MMGGTLVGEDGDSGVAVGSGCAASPAVGEASAWAAVAGVSVGSAGSAGAGVGEGSAWDAVAGVSVGSGPVVGTMPGPAGPPVSGSPALSTARRFTGLSRPPSLITVP